ncbi:MAG: outer membrane protein assembly factor BamE [Phycisphaerales bacterium]
MHTIVRLSLGTFAAASLACASGCLVNTHSSTTYSGRHISRETVKQITPGTTKRDFIVATLGEPNSKSTLDDGAEVWKYEYRKSTRSAAAVFLIVDADKSVETTGATYVIIGTDGVVQKVWQE